MTPYEDPYPNPTVSTQFIGGARFCRWLALTLALWSIHPATGYSDNETAEGVLTVEGMTVEQFDAAVEHAHQYLDEHPRADLNPEQDVPDAVPPDENKVINGAREAEPHVLIRATNGLLRFGVVSTGASIGDYFRDAASPNIVDSGMLSDPSFWETSVPIGFVAGSASGLLGVFNYEFQYYLDNYVCWSLALRKISERAANPKQPTNRVTAPFTITANAAARVLEPVTRNQLHRAVAKEVDGLLASIKAEYVYMVITTTGIVMMHPDEFAGILPLLGVAGLVTLKGFSAQTFLEVSAARQTRSLKAKMSEFRAKIVQSSADLLLTGISGIVVGSQVASFIPDTRWAGHVLVGLTFAGVANYLINMRTRIKNGTFINSADLPAPTTPPSKPAPQASPLQCATAGFGSIGRRLLRR